VKVYFDARMIDHPGIGRYMRCLLASITKESSVDLYLLGNREKIKRLFPFQVKVIDFDCPIYSIQEQFGFLKLKGVIGGDILHVPHYNIPILAKFNLIATIHDLIHIIYPEGASGKLAPMYMKFMVKRVLKTAKAVICVSQATKDEIEKRLLRRFAPRNDDKLHVIYEGVDEVFTKITDLVYLNSVKEKYRLPDKFILYVGSIRRHKNIKALLDAFENFRKRSPGTSLVMVGRLSQDISIKREGVIYLGEVESDKELAATYNIAACLLNLSLYEGFGLTILEAQRCGLPVVCSDIPVHKEIGGEGVNAVEASYIDQISQNLYNILSNRDIKEALILKGFKNADKFSWRKTAQDTIDLYRKAGNEGSDSSRLALGDARRREDPKCLL
jgi:glycosyltransferase involved in cell wall biosynthesis